MFHIFNDKECYIIYRPIAATATAAVCTAVPTSPSSTQAATLPTSPDITQLQNQAAISFEEPAQLEESNLESSIPTPDLDTTDTNEPEFTIVIGGSRKGSDLLISQGYSYSRDGKVNKKGEQRWKCTIRNKTINCLASVTQHGDVFKR